MLLWVARVCYVVARVPGVLLCGCKGTRVVSRMLLSGC